MITEKNVASEFAGFWFECFPLLTPSFVKVFNEAYCENLSDLPLNIFEQIQIGTHVTKHDLGAEFSFCLAEIANNRSFSAESFRKDDEIIREAYDKAVSFLRKYLDDSGEIILNQEEIGESFLIAKQYQHFFKYLSVNDITFRPKLKGAGFLGACTADLSVGDMSGLVAIGVRS